MEGDVFKDIWDNLPEDIRAQLTLKNLAEVYKLIEDNKGKLIVEIDSANLIEAAWIISGCFEFIDKKVAESVEINNVEKSTELKDGVDFIVLIRVLTSLDNLYRATAILAKLISRIIKYKKKKRQYKLKAWINKKEIW